MKFYSENYQCLEVFATVEEENRGKIILTCKENTEVQEWKVEKPYNRLRISIIPEQSYELFSRGAEIRLAYLSECEDLLEKGVCFIEERKNYKQGNLKEWYETPWREQYHFVPFKGWCNDPNALCYYKGYYHLYYQFNPFGQAWDNMFWGHAASKDLIHWVHLPVAFEPQKELLNTTKEKGGAFSGSAVITEDNRMLVYLTRHWDRVGETGQTIEYQTMSTSTDSIHFSEEQVIIENPGNGIGNDFRDPKVEEINGIWNMVLGARINEIPGILYYQSEDREHWEQKGTLLLEENEPTLRTIECPDFFELDHCYVAVAAFMWHIDSYQRKQGTYYYLGDWKNNTFQKKSRGLYDFGSNFYAVQSFEHQGRRIAVGWISDFYNEHRERENGCYGSMSIPRELHVKNGKLYQIPVKEMYELLGEEVDGWKLSNKMEPIRIKGNSYYVKLILKEEMNFTLLLGREEDKELWFYYQEGIAEIKTIGTNAEQVRFPADINGLKELEIFVDRRVCEVYLNKGEAAGTKLFYTDSMDGYFQAQFFNIEKIEYFTVRKMKSIW